MIRFTEVKDGSVLGFVRLVDGVLYGDGGLQRMCDAWTVFQRKPAAEFMVFYADWSNGYMQGKQVGA